MGIFLIFPSSSYTSIFPFLIRDSFDSGPRRHFWTASDRPYRSKRVHKAAGEGCRSSRGFRTRSPGRERTPPIASSGTSSNWGFSISWLFSNWVCVCFQIWSVGQSKFTDCCIHLCSWIVSCSSEQRDWPYWVFSWYWSSGYWIWNRQVKAQVSDWNRILIFPVLLAQSALISTLSDHGRLTEEFFSSIKLELGELRFAVNKTEVNSCHVLKFP